MSPIEERKVREMITGMSQEQRAVALECMPTYQITAEIYRRDAEKETIISQIQGALKPTEKELR